MKRLLILDDDAKQRRVLQILAHKIGLDGLAADGTDQALALFREQRCDLVVTDLQMPGRDGIDFLRELRAVDAEVPVIVLTGHGTVATAVEAMKLGAVDYLQKPFDVDALEIVVRRALDHSRSRLENLFLREQAAQDGGFGQLIGAAPGRRPAPCS